MKTCPSCGRQNPDDRDFCECGEYLRWEPTGFMEAVAPAPPPPPAAEPPAAAPPAAAPPPPPPPPAAGPPPPPPPPAAAPPPPPPPAPPAPQAPAAPAPPAPAPQPAAPSLASLSLRVPDADGVPGQTVRVGCEPGGRARILALIRNASQIVDNYALEVEGVKPQWYTIVPNPVYLNPFGTAGAYEQEVEIQFHPPRAPEAESRLWELQVVARSGAYGQEAARAPLVLGIQPYEEFEPRLKPEKASGRSKADFDVSVRNKANAPVEVALAISDPEDALQSSFGTRRVAVPAGETKGTKLTVRPPRRIWIGRPVEHRFEVLARSGEEGEAMLEEEELAAEAAGGGPGLGGLKKLGAAQGPRVRVGPGGVKFQDPKLKVKKPVVPSKSFGLEDLKPQGGAAPQWNAPLLPTQAVFRQKPLIPRWLALLVALLVIAAVVIFLLLPKDVGVPDVRGEKVFDATRALTEAKLTLNPVIKQQVSSKPPGTIIDQTPAAGAKVSENTVVSLLQAVGSGDKRVPDVAGKTFAEASKLIDGAGLQVGAVNPPPPDPAKKVRSTIPAAGEVVKAGKAVQVFLVVPKAKVAEAATKENGGDKKQAPKGPVPVPAIAAGASAEAAAAALSKAGMAPDVKAVFTDEAKPGVVFKSEPPAGQPLPAGSTVKLFKSLGIPQVAFDTDQDIKVVDGLGGKTVLSLAGPDRKTNPSYDATGSRLVYVSDGQIMAVDTAKPDANPVPLTSGSDQWRVPVFAPTSSANVMAAIKLHADGKAGDLCVGPVGKDGFQPKCDAQGQIGFGYVLRWAPDGRSLFSSGTRDLGLPTQKSAIYRWTSKTAYSDDRGEWGTAKALTNDSDPAKFAIDLAISPDGKQMAVVANFDSRDFRLYLTKPGDWGLTKARRAPVEACKVAWRPDSLELLVVKAADCSGPGEVARVDAARPRDSFSLGLTGDSPAFSPVPPPAGKTG